MVFRICAFWHGVGLAWYRVIHAELIRADIPSASVPIQVTSSEHEEQHNHK